jgi:hypothetical protein
MRLVVLGLSPIFALSGADRDGPDWNKAGEAAWRQRDSQAETVFAGRMWIFGGWFNSFEAPPRDVWSSADGKQWERVNESAPWLHSDLAMSITFGGKMWMMGGWYNGRLPGHSASAAVWSSTDGKKWTEETRNAGWSPRISAALVEFEGRMWVLGGTENYYFGDRSSLKNDVWSSADGRTWRQETANAGWFPRAYHQAAVLNGRIYVFGGGSYVPDYEARNDVWSSEDGVNWREETASAGWWPRLWFSSAVYRDRMWVLGGYSKIPDTNWGDVWYSKNGRQWTRLRSKVTWKERHEHSVFVHQERLWVAGGHAKPLSREVWWLELPRDFFAGE